jgi:hypothetical protein
MLIVLFHAWILDMRNARADEARQADMRPTGLEGEDEEDVDCALADGCTLFPESRFFCRPVLTDPCKRMDQCVCRVELRAKETVQ